MALVVDASVGLKWVLPEPDSHLAERLVLRESELLVPDFWLNEATNVLWLQVRKQRFTADEAREALGLLGAQIVPTPTAGMELRTYCFHPQNPVYGSNRAALITPIRA